MKKSKRKNINKISSRTTNYPAGDFLIRVKNAAMARKKEVSFRDVKFIFEVAKVLKDKGILKDVERKDGEILVKLSYFKKEPVLLNIKLVSKPGLRIYKSADDIESVKGPSILVISTSKGVMDGREAVKKNLGGEVIAEIL